MKSIVIARTCAFEPAQDGTKGLPCQLRGIESPALQETACNTGDEIQSLGGEDLLEKEIPNHSSILAWEIEWTGEPGGLHTVHRVARVRHDLATTPPPPPGWYKGGLFTCIIPDYTYNQMPYRCVRHQRVAG